MKADVSRFTFDPLKGYARVLQQQGRPHVDADWNEQVAILLHRLHLLGRDLIGLHGGPWDGSGFLIEGFAGGPHDFKISAGRYYVNGVCCENHVETTFSKQPVRVHQPAGEAGKFYLVFLDAWEEVVSQATDANLLEPALGGIDTSARTRIAWQVRTHLVRPTDDPKWVEDNWAALLENWQPRQRGELKARFASGAEDIAPEQPLAAPVRRYRGLENQLYRIEIHYGGTADAGQDSATFKWSRENGAVMLRLLKKRGEVLRLEQLDASGATTLTAGDWLEEVAPGQTHSQTPRAPLIRVLGRGPERDEVTVEASEVAAALNPERPGGVWLRRWEQRARQANRGGAGLRDGTIPITEGEGNNGWIGLENGVEVQFSPGGRYRPGDYWVVPARIAGDGRLLWPEDPEKPNLPRALPPNGVDHGYAPLAIVELKAGMTDRKHSCRRGFKPLASIMI